MRIFPTGTKVIVCQGTFLVTTLLSAHYGAVLVGVPINRIITEVGRFYDNEKT